MWNGVELELLMLLNFWRMEESVDQSASRSVSQSYEWMIGGLDRRDWRGEQNWHAKTGDGKEVGRREN